jgi:hypothetical protein
LEEQKKNIMIHDSQPRVSKSKRRRHEGVFVPVPSVGGIGSLCLAKMQITITLLKKDLVHISAS